MCSRAKIPHQPNGEKARTNDSATWSTFDDVVDAAGRGGFDGIGFVFSPNDPYFGVDLDGCLDKEGRPTELALDVVQELRTYTEVSVLGRGLHCIGRGTMPPRRNRPGFEVYDRERFFVMTGRVWVDSPTEQIRECTEELRVVCARYASTKANGSAEGAELSDSEKILKGQRHNALVRRATWLRKQGLSSIELLGALMAYNRAHCDPPLSDAEVRGIAQWSGDTVEPEARSIRSYLEIAPSPNQLARLAEAPPIVATATHLLYPRTTSVYCGQTGTGKTTSALRVGIDLVYGREPWTGRYAGREPMRVLVLSKDDTTLSIVKKVVALAPGAGWMADGRITIIGKEKRPSRLDAAGLEILGNTIADGRFGAFVIDPYQHFLPTDWTVNDDAGAQFMIENLDALADSLHAAGLLIHHPRKRGPKAKDPLEMTKSERLEEIRGSAVLAQLARAVATLWEVEPGRRMLDAVVNDVPPLAELYFETSAIGDREIKWELSGAPTDRQEEAVRRRFLDLEPGVYSVSTLARCLFDLGEKKKPSGQRRTQAKAYARRFAEESPERFRVLSNGGLEVLVGDDLEL